MIRKALSELRLWAFTREFTFMDAPGAGGGKSAVRGSGGGDGGGGRIMIKGWAELLGEVADHQSLVASLKGSAYYSMFRVGVPLQRRGAPSGIHGPPWALAATCLPPRHSLRSPELDRVFCAQRACHPAPASVTPYSCPT